MTLRSPVGAALLLATLVSSSPAQIPTGHVAWHDLITPDLEVSKAFYSGLSAGLARTNLGRGREIRRGRDDGRRHGGARRVERGQANPSQWITYFAVNDVHRSVKLATDSGAKVVVKPTTTGSWHDESALLTDPQGAAFALMKPGSGPMTA
jgi:predicted enzyme related to lactoylglutathione lyase